tara:strand:- start:3248 stop:3589 length:342 start_codon:yes stop_codon:yes gene_type:complete
MTLKEIIERFTIFDLYEKRVITDDYAELVFYNKDLDEWSKIFVDIFGPAKKPKGVKTTQEDLDLTNNYGGVYDSQTLFKKEDNGVIKIAMLWPWQSGDYTTLKIIFLKNKTEA